MTSPPVDTSREAIDRVFSNLYGEGPYGCWADDARNIADALRTALDAAQVREDELAEICCERNTEIASARLERDAEKARADRVAGALRDLAFEYRQSDESVGLFAMPELADDLAELANELSPAKDSPT